MKNIINENNFEKALDKIKNTKVNLKQPKTKNKEKKL